VRKYKFKLEVSVEANDIEEARLVAVEKMLDTLNKPEAIKLVEVEEVEEE